MYVSYDKLDGKARCWIFITDKSIIEKKHLVSDCLKNLCQKWVSHGKDVISSFQLYKENFIILFAEDGISGCSIDSSSGLLRESLNQLKIDIEPNSKIGIFNGDNIEFKDRPTLIKLINNKKIRVQDKMINTTVKNKEEFDENWILEINKSWLINFIK